MKRELLQDIKNAFPDEYPSNGFDYFPKVEDLLKLFVIINKHVFRDKLDISTLKFEIRDFSLSLNEERGSYVMVDEDGMKSKIILYVFENGNNFSQIVSILCHEMIHMYDRHYGKFKEKLQDLFHRKMPIEVMKMNGTQYVNGYDTHGKYFCDWMSKFMQYGIKIQIQYSVTDRKLLKEEIESIIGEDMEKSWKNSKIDMTMFNDKTLVESDTVDDPEFKARLEMFVDGLKNDAKAFGYIDKNHWYISIS